MTRSKPNRRLAIAMAAAIAVAALLPQAALANCKFSGGKIFSLTKEKGKPMQVLATFSGSGNWWRFETRDRDFQNMLTTAFFNKKRIYLTGSNAKCIVPRYSIVGSSNPRQGGSIIRVFAL